MTARDLTPAERIDWLRLIRTEGIGPVTFHRLLDQFGSARAALDALPDLARRGGRKAPLKPATEAAAKKELEIADRAGAVMIAYPEPLYPTALSAIEDAPPLLFAFGDTALLREDRPRIAMVGARNASINGSRFANRLAADLGQAGQIVVSGMARGIDAAAHDGALATGTIAVLGGGIDVIYPRENRDLYARLKTDALILSEAPLGMEPLARHFPRRNRIISGLSTGVVVVEATAKSGSLITARMAAEQGRDIFAVPGSPAEPRAAGPNALIRDGAVLVRDARDILDELQADRLGRSGLREQRSFDFDAAPKAVKPDDVDDALRARVADALTVTPVDMDALLDHIGAAPALVATVLLELELAGRLARFPGNRVALIDPC